VRYLRAELGPLRKVPATQSVPPIRKPWPASASAAFFDIPQT